MKRAKHFGRQRARVLLLATAGWAVWGASAMALPNASPIQQQAAAAVVRDLALGSESVLVERHLEVLAPFTVLPADSALRVTSAKAGFTPGTWMLRLECASLRDCLPFHALLRLPGVAVAALREAGAAGPRLPSLEGRTAGRLPRADALARRGDEVELVEDLSGVRFRVRAVCLESGAMGETIRVENRATRRVLLATVAGQNLVRVQP